MNETQLRQLEEEGLNYQEVVARFVGNEELLEKFLIKFLEDTNYKQMLESLEKKEYLEAFNYAHTLKGLTANLGLNHFYKAICPIVETLRQGQEPDGQQLQVLEKHYCKITEVIRSLKN